MVRMLDMLRLAAIGVDFFLTVPRAPRRRR
jgi:hypothetical protein